MHGGAPGSGAPIGNRNAVKSGFYTREAIAERKRMRAFLKEARKLLDEVASTSSRSEPSGSSSRDDGTDEDARRMPRPN